MNKRTEEKILEEIRRRVIELDSKQSEQLDQNELRKANIEALAEITSVDRQQIERIAAQVQKEVVERQARQRRLLVRSVVIALLVGGIWALWYFNRSPKMNFTDTFDSNNNKWDLYQEFEYRRWYENGKYMFQNAKEGWNYWDYVSYQLPQNYSLELTTNWIKGKYDDYGLTLLADNTNYDVFVLRADGAAGTVRVTNNEYVENDNWSLNIGNTSDAQNANVIRLDVWNKEYQYFVNDKLFKTGKLPEWKYNYFGVYVGELQIVAFDRIAISQLNADKSKKLLWEDTFDNNTGLWGVTEKYDKWSEIKDGSYVFTGNVEDNCSWASIPMSVDVFDEHEISLDCKWQKGELASYGLMLLSDDTHYHAFELRNDGTARVVRSEEGNYSYIGDFVKTPMTSDGKKTYTLRVKISGGDYEFWVDDQRIGDGYITNNVEQIGIRVCGRQTIAFDNLTVKEK